MMTKPAILIAGTGSGVGKTSVTLGIVAALKQRGLTVQTFKVGPDFLDPTWLSLASGRPCYNLDSWICGKKYMCELFAKKSADADVAVIEGVMGLFDGASPVNSEGSSAEIARWLRLPVLLVVDSHGLSRTMAATVSGFCNFEAGVNIAAVIANRSGSSRHADWLAQSLSAASLPPLAGAIPRNSLPTLPGRHLGLVTATESLMTQELLQQLADQIEKHINLDLVLELAADNQNLPTIPQPETEAATSSPPDQRGEDRVHLTDLPQTALERVRIGIAKDEAFHFYYQDDLETLTDCGAELVFFSPIHDSPLPPDLDGIWLGGGYPELYAAQLSANSGMLADIRGFIASGGPLYAECGGLIYLSRKIELLDGACHPLVAALPLDTRMLPRRKALGYVEVTLQQDTLLGKAGLVLRGHEFHYSEVVEPADTGLKRPYLTSARNRNKGAEAGYQNENLLASYIHLRLAAHPDAAAEYIKTCRSYHARKSADP